MGEFEGIQAMGKVCLTRCCHVTLSSKKFTQRENIFNCREEETHKSSGESLIHDQRSRQPGSEATGFVLQKILQIIFLSYSQCSGKETKRLCSRYGNVPECKLVGKYLRCFSLRRDYSDLRG